MTSALDPTVRQEMPSLFWLEGLDGLNQHEQRASIEDQECYWMEGFVPLGKGNARTIYDKGAALYTTTGTLSIIYDFPFNIGTNFYHAVFLSDGSAVQVTNPGGGTAVIGTAATFATGPTLPHCAQQGASGIVIVTADANGYFAWDDGALVYPWRNRAHVVRWWGRLDHAHGLIRTSG